MADKHCYSLWSCVQMSNGSYHIRFWVFEAFSRTTSDPWGFVALVNAFVPFWHPNLSTSPLYIYLYSETPLFSQQWIGPQVPLPLLLLHLHWRSSLKRRWVLKSTSLELIQNQEQKSTLRVGDSRIRGGGGEISFPHTSKWKQKLSFSQN